MVTVTASAPTITSTMDWPAVWLPIAHAHAQRARAARAAYATSSDTSATLQEEFEAGLGAVTAAAFAVEAAKIRAMGSGKVVTKTPPAKPQWRDLNVGDWLGQYLVERGEIQPAEALDLGKLFSLRHSCVHADAVPSGLAMHPVGTSTSPELVMYNADVIGPLVVLAGGIVRVLS